MTTTPDTERRERMETAIRRSAQKKYYETDSEYYAALTDAVIAADQAHAAEVRAAAFDQAADAVRSGAIQFDSEAAAHALTNGGGIALIAYVQTAIADALSHRAAAARPDNTHPVHQCGNCDGIDPDTCLMNPARPDNTRGA